MAAGYVHTVYKREYVGHRDRGWRRAPPEATRRKKSPFQRHARRRSTADEEHACIHNQDGTISERNSYDHDPAVTTRVARRRLSRIRKL